MLFLGAIALMMVALPQLYYPLGFDQAVYAACGYAIKNGGVPIRDCFETKQMGVMVMYALPMLFTLSPIAIHAFTLVWVALTAGVIGWVVNATVETRGERVSADKIPHSNVHNKTRTLGVHVSRTPQETRTPSARVSTGDVWPGVIAGVFYWLIYAGINYWSMDQAETFANLFIVLAFYLLWRGAQNDGDIGRMLLAGVCIGIAAWFKYVFGLLGIALGVGMLVHTLASKPLYPGQSLITNAITYAMGVLAVLGLGIGFYTLLQGGLDTLIQQLNFLRANFPLAEPLPPMGMLGMMLRVFDNGADSTAGFKATVTQWTIFGGGFPLIFVLALIGLVRSLRRRAVLAAYRRKEHRTRIFRINADLKQTFIKKSAKISVHPRPIWLFSGFSDRLLVLYILLWLSAAIAIVIWQGNYIQYHYFVLWPPIVLLAGLSVNGEETRRTGAEEKTTPPTQPSAKRHLLTVFSSCIALAAIALLALRMGPWLNDAYINVVVQRKSLAQLYEESYQAPNLPIAKYLREHTQATDRIAIFGDAPWVYTLADRPNATRFSFVNVWIKKRGTQNYDLMVQQYLNDLQHHRPLYFLLTKPNFPWPNNDYIEDYKQAKPIYNYVEASYQYEVEVGEFLVFRRK